MREVCQTFPALQTGLGGSGSRATGLYPLRTDTAACAATLADRLIPLIFVASVFARSAPGPRRVSPRLHPSSILRARSP